MLTVVLPDSLHTQRAYAATFVLSGLLNVPMEIVVDARVPRARITVGGNESLEIGDGFFGQAQGNWRSPLSLPGSPVTLWNDTVTQYPKPFPDLFPTGLSDSRCELGYDVLGLCFFMLSRYEEVVRPERDEHGRFPDDLNAAWRTGTAHRPLVDEAAEVLRRRMKLLWPALPTPSTPATIATSHDVDVPFQYVNCGLLDLGRDLGVALLRHRSARRVPSTLFSWWRVKMNGEALDPANTFDDIMDLNERVGLRAKFYFQASEDPLGRSAHRNLYALDSPPIASLLSRIAVRGHEIGLHPSYAAHDDDRVLQAEVDALRRACSRIGIEIDSLGARMHFLRWDASCSPRRLEVAGVASDSTLGFASEPGFRCGTAHAFPLYDFTRESVSPVVEQPLLVMDASLDRRQYLGLNLGSKTGWSEAIKRLDAIANAVRDTGGCFTVLWHNNVLADPPQWALFNSVVDDWMGREEVSKSNGVTC